MRLPRPYIPLRIRNQVAERQVRERGGCPFSDTQGPWTLSERLQFNLVLLSHLGLQGKLELHHRPALCNRMYNEQANYYYPDANDPEFLVYLPVDEHDIETRVRGQHGDYSDLAKARKRKRKEKKARHKWRKFKWSKRPFSNYSLPAKKRKWPKRKFPKRSK